jgi:hypothetical protein
VPDAHRCLLIRLRLEKEKLLGWAVLADLGEDESKMRPAVKMNRNGLIDSLRAMQTLLMDFGRRKGGAVSLVAAEESVDGEDTMETPTDRKVRTWWTMALVQCSGHLR